MTDPLIAEYRESIRLVQRRRDELAVETDHYRTALERIESHSSGDAVRIAREALALGERIAKGKPTLSESDA